MGRGRLGSTTPILGSIFRKYRRNDLRCRFLRQKENVRSTQRVTQPSSGFALIKSE